MPIKNACIALLTPVIFAPRYVRLLHQIISPMKCPSSSHYRQSRTRTSVGKAADSCTRYRKKQHRKNKFSERFLAGDKSNSKVLKEFGKQQCWGNQCVNI